jgi:uncharacterized protein
MERIADLLLRYPKSLMAALVALVIAATAYLVVFGVQFDYNIENFLPAGDPTIEEYRAFTQKYEPDDVHIVVGFEAPDMFALPVLTDIEAITARLEAIENVREVVSLANVQGLRGTEDGIEVRRLVGVLHADSLASYRSSVLSDSAAVGYVVNAAATTTAFFIEIDTEDNSYEQRGRVIAQTKQVLAEYEDRYEFRYSGFPYLRNNYVNMLQREMVKYVALSSVIIMLVLLWMFRNVRSVVLPLVITYIGVLLTVTAMMLFNSPIDVLTSTVASLILVVGVADSMHLLVKYYNGLNDGLGKREALREMIVRLGAATFLTSVTTAIGFGTLVTSTVVPMQRFGVFTAVGVLLTFFVSLVMLAVVLSWMKPPRPEQIRRLGGGGFRAFLVHVDRFAENRRWGIIAVGAVTTLLALAGATQLRVNSYVNDDLGPRSRVHQDMVFFQENLVSPFRFELLVTAPEEEAFKEPERLRQIEAIGDYLRAQPEVRRVVSTADVLKQLNRAMHADSAAYYVLPESRELAAQYLFLMEMTDEDLLRHFVDFDYSEARIAVMMDDAGSYRMRTFRAGLDSVLAVTLAPDVRTTQTGTIVLAAGLSDYLVESLLYSIGLAFLFISILMGALFRNVKLVLISLVPNVIPLVMVAGVMGFAGIDIKPATAVIFSISFGIAVDDTIHFLARLRQELRLGRELREAIHITMLGTGKAIILTSIVLLGGFGSLLTSSFQSTMYMGMLVSATIFTAVLADLLLLPALLHVLKPKLSMVGVQNTKQVGV